MLRKGFEAFLQDFLKIALILTVIISILKIQSILYVIPFLNIKKIEIQGSDKSVKGVVQKVLAEDYNNNYLLLSVNGANFIKEVSKASKYYIKSVKVLGFDWIKGVLRLKVETRKPAFVLNRKFFIGNDGVVFGANFRFQKPVLLDFNKKWNYGEKYTTLDIANLEKISQKFGINTVKVGNFSVNMEGSRVVVNYPLGKISLKQVGKYLEDVTGYLGKDNKILLSFYGKKTYALKTLKE